MRTTRKLSLGTATFVTVGLHLALAAGTAAGCAESSEVGAAFDGGGTSIVLPPDAGDPNAEVDADEGEVPCAVGNLCRRAIPMKIGSVSTMSGRSKTDVWAAGTHGLFLHWDGAQWSALGSDREVVETVSSLFLTPSETWAVAGTRIIRRDLDPASVLRLDVSDAHYRALTSLAVIDDEVYVGYARGNLKFDAPVGVGKFVDLDGGELDSGSYTNLLEDGPPATLPASSQPENINVRAMFLVPGEALWVVGDRAMVARYPVTPVATGTVFPMAVQRDLLAAWSNGGELWASGADGTIVHFDGTAWEVEESGTSASLQAIFGFSAKDIWAAGEEGTVLHYDGESWSKLPIKNYQGTLRTIWGASPDDVWIGGEGAMFHWGPLP